MQLGVAGSPHLGQAVSSSPHVDRMEAWVLGQHICTTTVSMREVVSYISSCCTSGQAGFALQHVHEVMPHVKPTVPHCTARPPHKADAHHCSG
jgi:hypothetical protein